MPTTYLEGHAKRNPADGTVAVRTVFPDPEDPIAEPILAAQAWLAATTSRGAHSYTTATVEGWDDLFVPEPPAPPEMPPAPEPDPAPEPEPTP